MPPPPPPSRLNSRCLKFRTGLARANIFLRTKLRDTCVGKIRLMIVNDLNRLTLFFVRLMEYIYLGFTRRFI